MYKKATFLFIVDMLSKRCNFENVIDRWYIRTSSPIPPFFGVYPNFVYPPIFEGISELVRISSDVNELYAIVGKRKIKLMIQNRTTVPFLHF